MEAISKVVYRKQTRNLFLLTTMFSFITISNFLDHSVQIIFASKEPALLVVIHELH